MITDCSCTHTLPNLHLWWSSHASGIFSALKGLRSRTNDREIKAARYIIIATFYWEPTNLFDRKLQGTHRDHLYHSPIQGRISSTFNNPLLPLLSWQVLIQPFLQYYSKIFKVTWSHCLKYALEAHSLILHRFYTSKVQVLSNWAQVFSPN